MSEDAATRMLYFFKAKVLRVIDGDTFEVMVDQGFRTYRKEKIRLLGVDAPETRTLNLEEKMLGEKVAAQVERTLEKHKNEVYISTWTQDSFGRWLADVFFDLDKKNTKTLNALVRLWSKEL